MLDSHDLLILAAFVALTAATLVLAPTLSYAQQQGSLSDTYSGDELVETGRRILRLGGARASPPWSSAPSASSACPMPTSSARKPAAPSSPAPATAKARMYTRNQGEHPIFWQGPTVGLDFGGDGSKVMMLVYNLSQISDVYGRYPGVERFRLRHRRPRHDRGEVRRRGDSPDPLRCRRRVSASMWAT